MHSVFFGVFIKRIHCLSPARRAQVQRGAAHLQQLPGFLIFAQKRPACFEVVFFDHDIGIAGNLDNDNFPVFSEKISNVFE